ncbi:MAG: DUF5916 domain-containing protein, partial [Lewinella sp.]
MKLHLLLLLFLPISLVAQSSLTYSLGMTDGTIKLDGLQEEAAWSKAEVAKGFQMQSPLDGVPATQATEVKILADDRFIYLSAVCYDTNGLVTQTLKRDQPDNSDLFIFWVDPIGEQTNGYGFAVTAWNGQTEGLVSDGDVDTSWDQKWFSATTRGEGKWTVEMAIPLKSIRYKQDQLNWRFNLARIDPGANETSVWSPVPRQFDPEDLGYYGDLIWPGAPGKQGGNVSFIPYARTALERDGDAANPATTGDIKAGADAKIALSPTLNLDLTYNPDFSQVEVDRQVTNLTRFNIFFPERRQFFLENADIFNSYGQFANSPFYSRRIGLDERGQAVPIRYGLRLSGNVGGKNRIGLLNMHSAPVEGGQTAQNYTAAAFQRRFWKRSSIKGIFLNRQGFSSGEATDGDYGRNAGGEINLSTSDGTLSGQAGLLKSFKKGVSSKDQHTYGFVDYQGQRFQANLFAQHIGENYFTDMGFNNRVENFNPESNEIVRIGYSQLSSNIDYYIYPEASTKVNFHWSGLENYVYINDNGTGLNEWYTRLRHFIFYKNTSQLRFRLNNNYVDLIFPFNLTGTPLPAGDYNFTEFNVQFNTDRRQKFQTEWFVVYGQFYNGTKLTYRGSLTYLAQPWGNFTLGIERNEIRLPAPFGDANFTLATGRAEINFSTNLFWTTFLQYNTQADNFNVNSRLQWRFA